VQVNLLAFFDPLVIQIIGSMAGMASHSQHNAQPLTAMLNVPIDTEGDFFIMRFTGSNDAINSLVFAIDGVGLTLPLTFEEDGNAAFDKALVIKMKSGDFPSAQDMDTFLTTQVPSLGVIDHDDNMDGFCATRRHAITPPIPENGFDVENVLLSLRDISRADGQGRIYDLGVITQSPRSNAADVVVLPSCL
jgi:hypothetical protein